MPVLTNFLNLTLAPRHNGATPIVISAANARASQNNPARWKVRTRNNLVQRINAHIRVMNERNTAIDHFGQIVRWNIRGHPHSNPARPIHQQIRNLSGQNTRFALMSIIVVLEIDSLFVDVSQQVMRNLAHTNFGITHRGGRVPVHRTKVTLTIEQWQSQGKVLRHTHQRVIDSLVTVRVIFTHHITDDTRRFTVGLVPLISAFVHRIENTAVNRFQPIPRIRQGTRHNHAHGIIEIRGFHLFFDGDRHDVFFTRRQSATISTSCTVPGTPVSALSSH